MRLPRARWLAVPVATFAIVFGASFAYHSRAEDEAPSASTTGAKISAPSGKERIAVSIREEQEGQSYVYLISQDGSGVKQLTFPPSEDAVADDGFAAWSPTGESIVIVRQVVPDPANPGHPNLYTISPDGTGLRRLSGDDDFDILPSWSPDGTRIAFSRLVDEQSTDVFTMNADGSDVARLTNDPEAHEDSPGWSPDGQHLVFTSVRGNEDLWVMRADGSDKKLLLGGPRHDGSADFSPDGTQIAFVREGHIAVMRVGGAEIRVLTSGEVKDSGPQWSPDGHRILFIRDPGELFVMNADGTGLAQVPIEGQAGGASWGPAE
jgi:TolB protein